MPTAVTLATWMTSVVTILKFHQAATFPGIPMDGEVCCRPTRKSRWDGIRWQLSGAFRWQEKRVDHQESLNIQIKMLAL